MRVKVCGMTLPEQVEELSTMGITFAGFIFYPKSPRYVFKGLTTSHIRKMNNINKVGVFVNASIEEVLHMVDECRLHMVQLHGDETPKYCEKIADYVSVVKAFRISENDNIEWMVKPYMDMCDMFMFDTLRFFYPEPLFAHFKGMRFVIIHRRSVDDCVVVNFQNGWQVMFLRCTYLYHISINTGCSIALQTLLLWPYP